MKDIISMVLLLSAFVLFSWWMISVGESCYQTDLKFNQTVKELNQAFTKVHQSLNSYDTAITKLEKSLDAYEKSLDGRVQTIVH